MMTLCDEMKQDDAAVIDALAQNMTIAPSNDVSDTVYWLTELADLVGIATAVRWFVHCSVVNETARIDDNLNWEIGVILSRSYSADELARAFELMCEQATVRASVERAKRG
jgi:hypothetical protein